MIAILKRVFLKDPANYWFWLVLALLIKGLPFIILLHNGPSPDTVIPGIWGNTASGDTFSYLGPIDYLLAHGIYSPDYRMPGYGFVYLIFRLLFSQTISCNLLILSQYLVAALSVYYLALAAKNIFNSTRIFYFTFYLFLISTYSNFYDSWLMTESFSTSFLIFSLYFFTLYFNSHRTKHLLLSGLFVTWVVFLRPALFPLPILFSFILILQLRKNNLPFAKAALLFILPFLLAYSAWVGKISMNNKKFVPLATSYMYYPQDDSSFVKPMSEFIYSWGGYADMMHQGSSLGWFGYYLTGTKQSDYPDSLPNYIYTSKFNKDSLLKLRQMVIALQDSTLNPTIVAAYQKKLTDKFNMYATSVREEKPYLYYIKATLFRCLPRFLYGPETKLYMKRGQAIGISGKVFENFYTIFYFAILLFGTIGMIVLLVNWSKFSYIILILSFIPIYTIIGHAIILRATNNRYFMPAWPFLLICAAYILSILYGKLKKPSVPA
jgi:hypothetical protein